MQPSGSMPSAPWGMPRPKEYPVSNCQQARSKQMYQTQTGCPLCYPRIVMISRLYTQQLASVTSTNFGT